MARRRFSRSTECDDCTCYCCLGMFGFVFLIFIISLFIPIAYIDPVFSIEKFNVPALDTATNKTQNITTISLEIQLQNLNQPIGVYYDVLDITLYYDQITSIPVANVSSPGLYQDSDYLLVKETVNTTGIPWETARGEVSNGTISFHLNLKTSVRYKKFRGKTERNGILIGGKVTVNNKGSMVNKGVVLSSASDQVIKFVQGVRLA